MYGRLVWRICQAKERSRSDLFGQKGRHRALRKKLRHDTLKDVKSRYKTLLKKREKADYDFHVDFSAEDVASLIDTAQGAIEQIDDTHSLIFRRMDLTWED